MVTASNPVASNAARCPWKHGTEPVTHGESERILAEFLDYQKRFVEQRSAWNDLPVCPFARQGRESGRIDYRVLEFSSLDCADPAGQFRQAVEEFAAQGRQLVLLLIHPDRRAMSYAELERLIDVELASYLASLDLEAFSGHPEHPLEIRGVYLRREPFITIQLIRRRTSQRATQSLQKRGYFTGWSAEAMQYAMAHSTGY